MKAAVYARMSVEAGGSDVTIDEQQRRGCAVVTSRNWTLVRDGDADTFTDHGISASSGAVRPAFERMLAARPDVIICRDVDRLVRSYRDLARLSDAGAQVAQWDGQVLDALMLGVLASLATSETMKISERVKLSEGRRVEAGKPPRGGRRPFGFNRDHEVIEAEAEVIRDVARRYLPPESETLASICRSLHAAGVTTPSGRPWQPSNLRAMLRSPRLAGLRTHRGKTYAGTWTPILDMATHRRLLSMNGGTAMREASVWMLNGVVWCGSCGNKLVGNGGGDRRYGCRPYVGKTDQNGNETTCGLSVDAAAVEREVWDQAIGRAWQVDDNDEERSKRLVSSARAALVDAQRRLEKIDQRYTSGTLTEDRWIKLGDDAQREVEAARGQLREAEDLRRSVPAWWRLLALDASEDEADERRRRAEVQAVVRRVTVKPATRPGRFDPARVEVEWR